MERSGQDEKILSGVYKSSVVLVGSLLKALYNFEVVDAEKIPKEGRIIFCFNHQSELDVIAFGIACAYPENKRHLHQMAKIELFKIPIVNAWVRSHFAFPLTRGENDILSFQRAKELLENEEMIGIYPEGTTNPGLGRFLEGHTGAVRLAYETNSPIIPAVVYGTDRIFGKGAKFPRFTGKITVKFGDVMNYDDIFGKLNREDSKFYKKAINRVMERIKNIYFEMFQSDKDNKGSNSND